MKDPKNKSFFGMLSRLKALGKSPKDIFAYGFSALSRLFKAPFDEDRSWTPIMKIGGLASIAGLLITLIIWISALTPTPNVLDEKNNRQHVSESSSIPTGEKIWKRNLLDQVSFSHSSYASEILQNGDKGLTKSKGIVRSRENGLELEIPKNTTLELSRPIQIPRHHFGRIFLFLDTNVYSGITAEPVFAYLIIDGKDPILLDTFILKRQKLGKYNITDLAGFKVTFLLRIQSNRDYTLILSLRKLFMSSEPLGGTIVIQAIQSWDGRNLDGYIDDFYFRVEKIQDGQSLFWQKVKMAKDGFTIVDTLQPGTYILKGVFNSIVLGEIGEIELTNELGVFKQFRVQQSKHIEVKVLWSDGTSPLEGADIQVETNRLEGGPIRGGDCPEFCILTRKNGVADLWLYPALDSDKDYYVIRVIYGGEEVARKFYWLGQSQSYVRKVNIVTDVSVK